MRPFMQTSVVHSWEATLEPFALEFPARCNWIEWAFRQQGAPGLDQLAAPGIRRDERNPALAAMIPERLVRN